MKDVNRILVIDDESDFSFFVKANLAHSHAYAVQTAESGREGLALADRFNPDLIVLDINMPQMDGLEVLGTLKGRRETRRIPVLVLSARPDGEERIGMVGLYCEGYAVKPLQMKELQEWVGMMLHSRRQ
jgi:DNA-binding response OmpR family regulator